MPFIESFFTSTLKIDSWINLLFFIRIHLFWWQFIWATCFLSYLIIHQEYFLIKCLESKRYHLIFLKSIILNGLVMFLLRSESVNNHRNKFLILMFLISVAVFGIGLVNYWRQTFLIFKSKSIWTEIKTCELPYLSVNKALDSL